MSPQIFRPNANTIARASIIAIILIGGVLTVALTMFARSAFPNKVNVNIEQPVQFSHKHHVGQLGISCLYCHANVDKSGFADFPPTHTCMSCHSQIWVNSPYLQIVRDSYANNTSIQWQKVYDLPDYVYFNHEIHVAKGVGCETCHGRIDQQPLTLKANTLFMSWCLNCHRDPAKYVRPVANEFDMGYVPAEPQATLGPKLVKEYNIMPPNQLTDCYICHR